MSKVIVILGPTASGKSSYAVSIAKKCNGEVISADSRQVYKGLNIGTGKITKREMRGVPHHLLGVASPKKQFSVSQYKTLVEKTLQYTVAKNKLPIVCGGSGLYIDTLLGNITIPEVPPNIALRKKLEKKNTLALFAMLKKIDPGRAKHIDKYNKVRLVRAIEIATVLGKVPTTWRTQTQFNVLYIGLKPRDLETRIKKRLAIRIKNGMIAEVRKLHAGGLSWKRMEALGLEYRYVSRYLRGFVTKEQMVQELRKESIKYSKRQMTWFRANKNVVWFDPNTKTTNKKVTRLVTEFIGKKA